METNVFYSPLVNAAKRGNSDDVEKLSEAFEHLEEKRRDFYPALYIAAYQGHENVIDTLLSKGADANYCFKNCLPPIHAAAQKGRVSVAKLLLDHGAKINLRLESQSGCRSVESEEAEYFSSPLLTAARGGHERMVKFLLSQGADINSKLQSKSVKVSDEIERLFVFGDYRDSDISKQSSMIGYSPLHFAVEAGEKNVVELLLRYGADVNSKSEMEITPLFIAIERDEESIIEILKKAGADMNVEVNGLSLLKLLILRENFGRSLKRKNQNKDETDTSNSNSEEGDIRKSTKLNSSSSKNIKSNEGICTIS